MFLARMYIIVNIAMYIGTDVCCAYMSHAIYVYTPLYSILIMSIIFLRFETSLIDSREKQEVIT